MVGPTVYFSLYILGRQDKEKEIVCKVRTQQAENFDEEVKSLVSAWFYPVLGLPLTLPPEKEKKDRDGGSVKGRPRTTPVSSFTVVTLVSVLLGR